MEPRVFSGTPQSIQTMTDVNASVVNTYDYDSFGNTTANIETVVQPYRYTAREYDAISGLYHYRARAYDAFAGRFGQEDPIGFRGGTNFYEYVKNNPIKYTDPAGLVCCSASDKLNCFGKCVEKNRVNLIGTALTSLGSFFPKIVLPPFRVAYQSQRLTTLLSVAEYFGIKGARELGRAAASPFLTGLFVGEGLIDIGVITFCGYLCNKDCNAY